MLHFDEAAAIWRDYVPKSGQADTVQGELLRAVEKLRDEATRNGNANWDSGFEILLDYLEKYLCNGSVYPPETVAETRARISRLRKTDDPCLDEDLFDELSDRVVEYFRHYGSVAHTKNRALRR
jgi:hypothetical protein